MNRTEVIRRLMLCEGEKSRMTTGCSLCKKEQKCLLLIIPLKRWKIQKQHKSVHTGGMCYSQGPLSGGGKTFKVVQWYCVVEQYRMAVLGYWEKKSKSN